MVIVTVHGRIAKKDKVKEYSEQVLTDLMPRLRRNVQIDIYVITECDEKNYALCWGDKDEVEIELARKDGYLDQAEKMFEKAISKKAPVDLYSEGLFKIWRLQNKNDLKSEKFKLVQERVLKMLDIYPHGVKITDARSLHKAADLLGNEEIKDRALKAIKVIESSK